MRPALLALLLGSLLVAGCGAAAGTPVASKHTVVKTRTGPLGTYLVDGKGRTLYRFMRDTGRRSSCFGACAQNWPALRSKEKPEAKGAVKQKRLSTKKRSDGGRQVLYRGHPLYRFSGDVSSGDTNGQGQNAFGGSWYVVAPSGKPILASSSTPSPY